MQTNSLPFAQLRSKRLPLLLRVYARLRWWICPFLVLEQLVPREGRIIDLGCGFGLFALYMADQEPRRLVIGVDIDQGRLRRARSLASSQANLSFECHDITRHELPNVDAITAVDFFHHIPSSIHQSQILDGCMASLRPGGLLVIKDIARRPHWKFIWNLIHDWLMSGGQPTHYLAEHEFIQMLQQSGFLIERVQGFIGYPYPHVAFVARKPGSERHVDVL